MTQEAARKTLLNVGCGRAPLPASFRREEWREIRHDIDPAVQPDVVGSMTDLSGYADASVDAVYSSHSLAHLPPHETPLALAEFRRVLKPGGVAWIIVPDVQALAERIAAGDLDGELYRSPAGPICAADLLWGHRVALAAGQQHLAHRNGFSAATLERALADAGFGPLKVQRNPKAFELFATAMRPASIEELFERAQEAQSHGRWTEAEALCREVLAREERHWPAWYELGIVCFRLGRLPEAVEHLQRSARLQPDFARAQLALGGFLDLQGRHAQAEPHLRRAAALDPGLAEAHYKLGNCLREQGDVVGAEASYREALRLEPRHHLARLNLANALFAQSRAREALPLYQTAAANIADIYVHTNLKMQLNFAPELPDAEVFAAHEELGRRHAAPLAAAAPPPRNVPDPQRRLRIGYLSRDFGRHSLRYFLMPLIRHHDHTRFEIVCYHFGDRSDEVTDYYRARADRFVDCGGLDDGQLAERIRGDAVDILVDLAGLTDRNRLRTVARRPAPVQIGWLGYPATTGVRALDYRISDRWIDPEPPAPPLASTEQPLRLAHGHFCYEPMTSSPEVNELPFDRNGYVTFGSLNQAPKLNGPLLALWARLLEALPGSRLLIQNVTTQHAPARARLLDAFAAEGIGPERVQFRPYEQAPTYLRTYHDVDIALDSFPYNGGTTTCEALWMGVPVVSRCGGRHVARLGASILNAVGLGELVADSAEGYLARALALAADAARLRALRATMRERLATSPLMDHVGFTRELESAYRQAWRAGCDCRRRDRHGG